MSNCAYCYSLLSFKLTLDNFTTDGKRVLFCGEWADHFRDIQDLLEEKLGSLVKIIYNHEEDYFLATISDYIEDDYNSVIFKHQELDIVKFAEVSKMLYLYLDRLTELNCKNIQNCEVKYHGFVDVER